MTRLSKAQKVPEKVTLIHPIHYHEDWPRAILGPVSWQRQIVAYGVLLCGVWLRQNLPPNNGDDTDSRDEAEEHCSSLAHQLASNACPHPDGRSSVIILPPTKEGSQG